MRVLAVVWVLLLGVGAGCVTPPPTAPATDSTAAPLLQIALERATTWDAQAQLLTALAVETPDPARDNEMHREALKGRSVMDGLRLHEALRASGDTSPGDGKAPAWGFAFSAPSGYRTIVVSAQGEIVLDEAFPWNVGWEPFPSYGSVDSDAAAALAAAKSHEFRAFMATPGARFQTQLRPLDGVLSWTLKGEAGDQWAYAIVNASSGDAVANVGKGLTQPKAMVATPGSPAFVPLGAESGVIDGQVLAPRESQNVAFVMERPHGMVWFVLEAIDAKGLVYVNAEFARPERGTFRMGVDGIGTGSTMGRSLAIEFVDAGVWRVEFSVSGGVMQEYRLSWCTEGEAGVHAQDNPACAVRPEDARA